jgi:hypothetical protein
LNLHFLAEFEFQIIYSNRVGPACQRLRTALTGEPGYPVPCTHHFTGDRTHHMVETAEPVAATHVCQSLIPAHGRCQRRPSSISLLPSAPLLLCSPATTTHRQLARVLANRSSIPSAPSFAKGSRCFCPWFCSLSSTPLTTTPDPITDLRRPPVSSLLCSSHCRPCAV